MTYNYNLDALIRLFDLVNSRQYWNNTWKDTDELNEIALEMDKLDGCQPTRERVTITDLDNMVDITFIRGGKVQCNIALVLSGDDPDEEYPYSIITAGETDGDAECDLKALIYQAYTGHDEVKEYDRSKSLSEKLDDAIEMAKYPSFEEGLRAILGTAFGQEETPEA